MESEVKKRIVKDIKVDVDKCIGCRACELACSAFHAEPKFSSSNPAKSRIRVMIDELKDVYVPVRGGDYTSAECAGRQTYTLEGKEYRECSFCRASCPSRGYFKDPDTGLPLECDMCANDPPLEEPWCVKVCKYDALTYEEREEEGEEAGKRDEMETRLEALTKEHGLQEVINAAARMVDKE